MRSSKLYWAGLVVIAVGATLVATPAQSQGVNVGVGAPIGNTGINVGSGYQFGRWNSRWQTGIFLDAGRYINRRRSRDRGDDRRNDRRKEGGREEQVVVENVRLKVSPKEASVYLNGQRVYADGRSELTLPAGNHRLEFVRQGYRTEVVELKVVDGLDFRVERKMEKLSKAEPGDPRLQNPAQPIPVLDAVKQTQTATRPVPGAPVASVPASVPASAPSAPTK